MGTKMEHEMETPIPLSVIAESGVSANYAPFMSIIVFGELDLLGPPSMDCI